MFVNCILKNLYNLTVKNWDVIKCLLTYDKIFFYTIISILI